MVQIVKANISVYGRRSEWDRISWKRDNETSDGYIGDVEILMIPTIDTAVIS